MTNIGVSFVIVTWNTASITQKCINTINQFLRDSLPYQIIVVDNNSVDETSLIIPKLPHVTYIKNDQNLGFSKANNIGAKEAQFEYLYFLNSDMELTDNQVVNMIKEFSNPQVGIVAPKFLNPDLSIQGSVFPDQNIINAFKEFWLKIPSYSKYSPHSSKPLSVWSVSGGAILIKKEIFNQIGGWDEKYFLYFEDLELCRQVRNLHLSIIFYPNSQVIHRHGASGAKLVDSKNQWRRLIKGSIIYHGYFKHILINTIIWLSQKLHLS